MEEVTIAKLVHGGQGLAELSDGRKVFVWNALPGETVGARIIKNKRSYAEAIAEDILIASSDRIEPREDNFLSTSPWQVISYAAENRYKSEIAQELFSHEGIEFSGVGEAVHDEHVWNYRNKMEYSFWGDENGLHLALHRRGSHGKQIVEGSKLALASLDVGARVVLAELKNLSIRAGDLKTIIVRSSQNDEVVAALYTKLNSFPKIDLPAELKGLRVYHSDPRSPASVPTRLLYEVGNSILEDKLLRRRFEYDVDSFFQVNLPVYERALSRIIEHCQSDPTDMYAGVGSIGLSVAKKHVTLVELDPATTAMARINGKSSDIEVDVKEASTENALDFITSDRPIIFDPPRAGLHNKVVKRCLEVRPPQIIYLSCNPATQARDLRLLQEAYYIAFFELYNFFPRTPHIETLAILQLKS